MESVNMVERQRKLEEESITLGVERYRKALTAGEADMPPGVKLLKNTVGVTEKAIKDYLGEVEKGVPSRSVGVARFLDQFEPDLAAFVVCRTVINGISKMMRLQTVALNIAASLEDTLNFDALREQDPKAYRQLIRKIEGSNNSRYRHVVMRRQQKYAGVSTIKWGTSERLRLGVLLIELMQQATGLFSVVRTSRRHNDTPLYLVPDAETLRWLEQSHARCELMSPVFMPMVCRPRQWSSPFSGGYISGRMRVSLIKGANKNLMEELKGADLPTVYGALNALQDTAWRINLRLFEALREVWDGGGNIGKLPPREGLSVPPKSFTEAEAETGAPTFREWKARAARTYEANVRLMSKRIQMQQKLWVAEKMAEFAQFHFVHALDFRGRAYAVASFLNPQGDDSAKALLEFAEGKPLGEEGAFWLAVHGANNYGVDKVSFEERVSWVQENHERIIEAAVNPLDGARWWTRADKPWQFLAFCCEWVKLNSWVNIIGGSQQDFVSHLPVGLDGACNGLQNFSAMLRDEVGGAATNLVPNDKPADIYSQVADESNRIAAQEAAEGNEVAARWAGRITRNLTKRNTMTVPYAVTEFGMKDQLMAEFSKLVEEAEERGGDVDEIIAHADMKDATYLASANYRAISKVVVAARRAMDWLQEVARVVASDGLPVQWRTPSGFTVVQDYRERIGERFNCTIAGRRVQILIEHLGDKPARRRMASGISPNFVHALDAAHMQRTVCYCRDAGVTSFAMIHDSYGTHASDVAVLSRLLRQAFVDQYADDVLGNFRSQMVSQLPPELAEKIPPLPPSGTLDLIAVMNSDYFFA